MANESTYLLAEMAVEIDRNCIKRLVRSYLNRPAAEDALALVRDATGDNERFTIITVELVD